jgi:ADP-ribose pyrophosphatase
VEIKTAEKITDQKWLNLFRVNWHNRGKTGEWIFASRKEEPKHGKAIPDPDAVIIVPIHVRRDHMGEHRKLITVREFRISIGDYEYSLPAGLRTDGESITDCAKRELKEETGLILTTIKRISPCIYSSTGLSDESVTMVFCECAGEISEAGLEETEVLTVHPLDIEQITQLSKNYHVKQSCKLWPLLLMFSLTKTLEI